jgi:hypothetical protein
MRRELAASFVVVHAAIAGAQPLGPTLRAAAHGSPLVVVQTGAELAIRSVDGTVAWPIAHDVVDAVLDPERQLVWFVADHALSVLDLAGDGSVVHIAEPFLSRFGITVDGQTRARSFGPVAELVWDARPRVQANRLACVECSPDGDDELVLTLGRARITNPRWLREHALGPRRAIPRLRFDRDHRVATDRGAMCGECGEVLALGATGWSLVISNAACDHDGCTRECRLWSPSAMSFVGKARDCHAQLDATRHRLVFADGHEVCDGRSCIDLGRAEALGFVDPGAIVELAPRPR